MNLSILTPFSLNSWLDQIAQTRADGRLYHLGLDISHNVGAEGVDSTATVKAELLHPWKDLSQYELTTFSAPCHYADIEDMRATLRAAITARKLHKLKSTENIAFTAPMPDTGVEAALTARIAQAEQILQRKISAPESYYSENRSPSIPVTYYIGATAEPLPGFTGCVSIVLYQERLGADTSAYKTLRALYVPLPPADK